MVFVAASSSPPPAFAFVVSPPRLSSSLRLALRRLSMMARTAFVQGARPRPRTARVIRRRNPLRDDEPVLRSLGEELERLLDGVVDLSRVGAPDVGAEQRVGDNLQRQVVE